ncbi:serine/threonine-protein kinase [Cryptosporangium aurantiacum]|uniref:Serine/threonine protein kinase n=1 Tax=Cryptosporangium aurantiacum TaxID=134849 RepID=A0A1M7RN03_9ACTN|nr:serine/threonine-protein kinase [Cryptosporangium aurantiacum]SHN47683.1 Serine/threonine protein kinase [Cryptosporangium aurantiacum]
MEPLQSTDPLRIGAFRVAARLGAGGMGRVYLAYSSAGRRVAVKVIHARFAADPEFRARFRREVTTARAVGGAFTAPILDADPDATNPWLATEYVVGPSLHAAVAQHGPLNVDAVFTLGAGLAEAVAAIHRAGVVHRDLKPANVLLGADGPRVIDFGIAHPVGATRLTEAGAVIGSPGFMAPEQLRGVADPATDVFALGAVLVYAATGENPFGRAAVPVLLYRLTNEEPQLGDVPDPSLRDLLGRCLLRDPAARPTTETVLDALAARNGAAKPAGTSWLPNAVAADITRILHELPAERPPLTRRRVLVGAALGGVTVVVGGGIAAATLLTDDEAEPTAAPATSVAPASTPSPTPAVTRVGRQRWRTKVGDYTSSGPATGSGRVYVGTPQLLHALDARTGKRRWTTPGDGEFRGVTLVGDHAIYASNADGYLYAVDPASGARRWRRRVGGIAPSAPVVVEGVVYVIGLATGQDSEGEGRTGDVVAVDAGTGSPHWTRTLTTRKATIHVTGGTVLVAGTDALHALDAAGGATRWRRPLAEPTPAVSVDRTVFCGDQQGAVHAIDLRTGAILWTTPASPDGLRTQPWADPDGARVFVCDEHGNLIMVDLARRAAGWTFAAGASNPPKGAAGSVVVAGNHSVYAVAAASGQPQWRFDVDGYVNDMARPAVTTDTVYLGDTDGDFYALDLAGGSSPAPG